MSIRLRFTLLYNAILALTLVIFGVVLYSIQADSTYKALKKDLTRSSETLGQSILRQVMNPNDPGKRPPNNAVPAEAASPEAAPPSGETAPSDAPSPASTPPPPGTAPNTSPPPPMPFQNFSSDRAFRDLPEREIVRVLDGAGNLVASPFGRSEDALPLDEEGLQALQNEKEWWASDYVNEQHMLIYNRPIVSNGKVAYILQVARPLTERDHSLQTLATTLVAASLVTLMAAFGIGWALSAVTLAPINRITQTAKTIGEERDFTRRVVHKGPQDEVGQLATTFNSMLARLQDAYQRVAHSLEMQRNFVADVSHELRTPLTTLRGNLSLLRRTPPIPAEDQADILNDMVDESDRLIRLVNDLLVLARADAGRNLAREPLSIRPLLEDACRQARQIERERQIELNSPEDLLIPGDRDAFKQVLLILLDNAIKHSQGSISVSAEAQEGQAEIRVQDYGSGIAPDKLEHVFDRFYRGDVTSTVPGFGLGLSIAKALVEAQGGEIRMESEPGKGSTLILDFPRLRISDFRADKPET